MKRLLLPAGLIIICCVLFAFQTDKHEKKTGNVKDATSNSLLWRISGKGLKKTSYLFGTIHMICTDDYVWTNKMRESFEKSEEACFEMNLDDPSVMMQAAAAMTDTTGKTLKDYFTEAQYKKLSQYLKDSIGIQIVMLQSMKPIALETIMTSKNLNCNNPLSYEETLLTEAKKENKKISGLEAPIEQISLLEKIPTDSIIKDIVSIIEGSEETAVVDEYYEMIKAYKNQDLPALYAKLLQSKELGDDLGPFLTDRNIKWISRIEKKIVERSVFIAVGAGHLWGDKGVIALLKKAGYSVEPVK